MNTPNLMLLSHHTCTANLWAVGHQQMNWKSAPIVPEQLKLELWTL